MSATRQTTIWCDGDCVEWYQVSGNAAHVRGMAARVGWLRARRHTSARGNERIDLCPECAKKEATKT